MSPSPPLCRGPSLMRFPVQNASTALYNSNPSIPLEYIYPRPCTHAICDSPRGQAVAGTFFLVTMVKGEDRLGSEKS